MTDLNHVLTPYSLNAMSSVSPDVSFGWNWILFQILKRLHDNKEKKLHRQRGLSFLPIFVSGGPWGLRTPSNISTDSPSAAAHIRHRTKRITLSPRGCRDLTNGSVSFSSVVQERTFGEGVVFLFRNRSSVLHSLTALIESCLSWPSLVFRESLAAVSFPSSWFKTVCIFEPNVVFNSVSWMELVKDSSGLILEFRKDILTSNWNRTSADLISVRTNRHCHELGNQQDIRLMTHVNCFTITFGRAYVDWQRPTEIWKAQANFMISTLTLTWHGHLKRLWTGCKRVLYRWIHTKLEL